MKNHSNPSNDPPRKKIICICHHGVSDSWSQKNILEERAAALHLGNKVEILARGIEPIRNTPQKQPDGTMRGITLTVDDIRESVLLCIHNRNSGIFRNRFGKAFWSALENHGLLYERSGRECQHVDKNTGRSKKHIQGCCQDFSNLLRSVLQRTVIENIIPESVLEAARKHDEQWTRNRVAAKSRRKHR